MTVRLPMRFPRLGWKSYALAVATVWTAIVLGMWWWSVSSDRRNTREIAEAQARAYFNKDQTFRFWGASHGGVYVPIDDRTPANPHLAHIPERDVTTPSGKRLTLMNPAYMIRQMNEQYTDLYGISGQITSLKPLRAENAPDQWERRALMSFERGTEEALEHTQTDGKPHLRLMRPMFTQEKCLKCHGHQGYQVGDVRGGVGVSVPLASLLAQEQSTVTALSSSFAALWMLGIVGITVASRQIDRRVRQYHEAEMAAKESQEFLQVLVDGIPEDLLVIDRDYNVLLANRAVAPSAQGSQAIGSRPKCYEAAHFGDSPCDGAGHDCPLQQVVATGNTVTVTHSHLDADGETIPVEIVAVPVKDDSGEVVQIIESCRDLRGRIRVDAELRARAEDMEQLNRLTVGRELRMIELKQETDSLLSELGREKKYDANVAEESDALPAAASNPANSI